MRIRALAVSVGIMVCLSVVGVACSSESDDGGGGSSGGGGASSGGTGNDAGSDASGQCGQFCADNACCDCSETQCLTAFDSCRCEPDCVDLIECIRDCAPTDVPCQTACGDAHQTGEEILSVLEACANKFCVSECQPAAGDAG